LSAHLIELKLLNKDIKQMNTNSDIVLANPRGFCAGVDRAIIIVEQALEKFGAPIYVRHEVVHNKFVVDQLRAKGAIFVEELDEIPAGSTVIFSAHGVSKAVRAEADTRGLTAYDATCPLVTKVHIEVEKMRKAGLEIVMIGHKGHPEVEGTMGQLDEQEDATGMYLVETPEDVAALQVRNPDMLAYVTQTTLSLDDAAMVVDALQKRFPNIKAPRSDSICYATQNRQDAIKIMAKDCDLVIIVGSPNSSNSNRLREVAQNQGVEAYMVDNASFLKPEWLTGKQKIGVSAGASAPEVLVQEVIAKLQQLGANQVQELHGVVENVVFQLPKNLTNAVKKSPSNH
jgi:4-hydroxy-3-methylbut-2-enyl diphosphate reductase